MRFEFKLPDLAEGMVEGEVVDWLASPGDDVKAEQPVVEVMTDKATVVIPSPYDGTLVELSHGAGDIVEVGATLFVMDVAAGITPEIMAATSVAAGAPQAQPEPSPDSGRAEGAAVPDAAAAKASPPVPRVPRGAGQVLATPATRRLARELGVDIGQVRGTGKAGRVSKSDVHASAAAAGAGPAVVAAIAPAAAAPSAAPLAAPVTPPTPSPTVYRYESRPVAGEETEERVKLRGLRRAIYGAMSRSKHTAAHFTYVEEVDCDNLVIARQQLKGAAEARGVRLTYLPFIAKAAMLALRSFPKMNAMMDDEAQEIVLKRHCHLGVAAATPGGLMVPVVKHADQLTLLDLAGHIQELGTGARDGRLPPDRLKGSTFTITSLGKLGGLLATPIINYPEVAILGVHQMKKRAVVIGDQIVARMMMNLSLSFDHRVIDGHEGAGFTQEIRRYLEDPALMMLEMA